MFRNMKMEMKVMCAIILMAVIVLIVGMVGMSQINKSRDEIAKITLPSIIAPEIIKEAQAAIQRGERAFSLFKGLMIGAIVLFILLAVATGILIRRNVADVVGGLMNNVRTSLNDLRNEMQRLTKASHEGMLSERCRPEKFQGDYAEIVRDVNQIMDAILLPIGEGNRILRLLHAGNLREKVEIVCKGDHERMKDAVNGLHSRLGELVVYVTKIAFGDLTPTMPKASEEDQIQEKLVLMKDNIHALVADVTMLAKAAVDGKFSTRADTAKHQGDFRKLVAGVNEILDAIIVPLALAAEYTDRITRGEIAPKMSDNDKSDSNKIFLEMVAQNKPFFK